MNPLTDADPMPFGVHRGKPMSDVSASYFHYLWSNGMNTLKCRDDAGNLYSDDRSRVADYIARNLSALKKEHRDGIW